MFSSEHRGRPKRNRRRAGTTRRPDGKHSSGGHDKDSQGGAGVGPKGESASKPIAYHERKASTPGASAPTSGRTLPEQTSGVDVERDIGQETTEPPVLPNESAQPSQDDEPKLDIKLARSSEEETQKTPVGRILGVSDQILAAPKQIEYASSTLNYQIQSLGKLMPIESRPRFDASKRERRIAARKALENLARCREFLIATLEEVASNALTDTPQDANEAFITTKSTSGQLDMLESRWKVAEGRRWVMMLDAQLRSIRNECLVEIEYPGGSLLLWQWPKAESQAIPTIAAQRDQKFGTIILSLLLCDGTDCSESRDRIERKVNQYRDANMRGHESIRDPKMEMLIQTILMNAEVDAFRNSGCASSEGLLVMGAFLETEEWPHVSPSALLPELVDIFGTRKRHVVLIHTAESRRVRKDGMIDKETHSAGIQDLIRSLYVQLMCWCTCEELGLDWMKIYTNSNQTMLRSGDLTSLCQLFRDLLLVLATTAALSGQRYTVVVIIDGANIFESEERAAYDFAINFFRAICDEAYLGVLGSAITFKYVLLHPGISTLLNRPHPAERLALIPKVLFDIPGGKFGYANSGYSEEGYVSEDLEGGQMMAAMPKVGGKGKSPQPQVGEL